MWCSISCLSLSCRTPRLICCYCCLCACVFIEIWNISFPIVTLIDSWHDSMFLHSSSVSTLKSDPYIQSTTGFPQAGKCTSTCWRTCFPISALSPCGLLRAPTLQSLFTIITFRFLEHQKLYQIIYIFSPLI